MNLKFLVTVAIMLVQAPAFAYVACVSYTEENGTEIFPNLNEEQDMNSARVTHSVEIGDYILQLIRIKSNGNFQARIIHNGDIIAKHTSAKLPVEVEINGYGMECDDVETDHD